MLAKGLRDQNNQTFPAEWFGPPGTIRQWLEMVCFFFVFFFCCIGSLLLRGLSLVAVSRGYSSLQCAGFSLRWLLFSSCGTRAQLLRGTWGPPEPGLEPVSPALAGGFLTPAPPWKSLEMVFFCCHSWGEEGASGTSWVEARDVAKHPAVHRKGPPQQRIVCPPVTVALRLRMPRVFFPDLAFSLSLRILT